MFVGWIRCSIVLQHGREIKSACRGMGDNMSNLLSKAGGVDDGTASQLCDACIALLKSFSPLLSQNFQDTIYFSIFQGILIKLQLWRDGFRLRELEKEKLELSINKKVPLCCGYYSVALWSVSVSQ
jgi:hypothetical protein